LHGISKRFGLIESALTEPEVHQGVLSNGYRALFPISKVTCFAEILESQKGEREKKYHGLFLHYLHLVNSYPLSCF
jgi:hypothetical protein